MKSNYSLALIAIVGSMFLTTANLRANETDDRIEAAAAKSHVFKTYLKNDSIKTESKNGLVTLTGTVNEASHKSLAESTVEKHMSRGFLIMLDQFGHGGKEPSHPSSPRSGKTGTHKFDVSKDRTPD